MTDVVHLSPRLGHGLTPCCRRRHDELPAGERITLYPSLVTCQHQHGAWCHPSADGCPDDLR